MDAIAIAGPARNLFAALRCASAASAKTHAAGLAAADWEAVVALALPHGVAPLLHKVLKDADALDALPPKARENLASERRATAMQNLRHYAEYERISRAMAKRSLPLMALKGLHLAERVYGDISLRPMADLDILVPESRVAEAIAVLQALDYGAAVDFTHAAAAMLEAKCNIGFGHREHEVYVEVHWKLSEPADAYAAPMEEIWRTAHRIQPGSGNALVMTPEFLLLHVCAHLACNHRFTFDLRALADIAGIVRAHPGLDWSAFTVQATRHGWRCGVATALLLAREHLGTAIPDAVLAATGADALDPVLVSEALEQLLASPHLPREMLHAPNLMDLAGLGIGGRLAKILHRVFVPRAELALLYGLPQGSPRLPLYYAVRLRDLLHRYGAGALSMQRSGTQLAAAAARHARLEKWIAGG